MLWFGDIATTRLPSPPVSSRLKSVRILDFMNPYSVEMNGAELALERVLHPRHKLIQTQLASTIIRYSCEKNMTNALLREKKSYNSVRSA